MDVCVATTARTTTSITRANWADLPILVLEKIFESLEPRERLNASETCHNWRNVIFQRKFFKDFKFRLMLDIDEQCAFFRNHLTNITFNLIISFDFMNVFHVDKLACILQRIQHCDNVQTLRLETNSVGMIPAGIPTESLVKFEDAIIKPLITFLSNKRRLCKVFDLGAIEVLTSYGYEFLNALENPQEMEQLALASVKYDPSWYQIFPIDPLSLQQFTNLQVLSLDYDALDDKVLQVLEILPLKKFLICVHGYDRQHPGVSAAAWTQFSKNFQNIELILTLIFAYEAVEMLHINILRRDMPITHMRVLFCDYINVDALDWIAVNCCNTLQSIQWIDSAYKHSSKNFMGLILSAGRHDPFVIMAWRCKNLREIVVHGYVMDLHNIVGISRLRGNNLKCLEVSMIDAIPNCHADAYRQEISSLLEQNWQPMNHRLLHPALGYMPVTDSLRDEYVYEVIRKDMAM